MVFCAAVAGLLLIGITSTQLGGKPAPPALGGQVRLPTAPALQPPLAAPVPAAATRSSSPAPSRPTTGPTTRPALGPATAAQRQRPPAGAATTATTATRRPTTVPATVLRIGAPVSLELAGASGYRVRHRDFRGRADRIGPGSPALDRADARFLVRAGRADDDCVSFESSNYPGRFLRHRDFEIRLDRVDGTRLFDRDATFCPESGNRAGVVALRSVNYPDRFLTEYRSLLRLTPATTGTATRFAVRPPL